ncbi:Pantothenate kinase [Frankliniella fusca]|uniref:Pantothenate kinase n=1 Tax=Frankliniella fusca TaxID=407009 RepID=A0AAE1I523_9NEOP|nr:Pantothenate kinase [Frankliniella fusca]
MLLPNCIHMFRFQYAASVTTTSMKNPAASVIRTASKISLARASPFTAPLDSISNVVSWKPYAGFNLRMYLWSVLNDGKAPGRKPHFAATWGQVPVAENKHMRSVYLPCLSAVVEFQ